MIIAFQRPTYVLGHFFVKRNNSKFNNFWGHPDTSFDNNKL
jgi:hypothetical protein